MVFILMKKVRRAESHCPNDDSTKFAVYALLIDEFGFEFCVGTVVKDETGRINFMFHTNSQNWKFKLDDLAPRRPNIANEFVCAGNSIVYGPFRDFLGDVEDHLFISTPTVEPDENDIEQPIRKTILPSPNYLRILIKYHFYLNHFLFIDSLIKSDF